MYEQVGSVYGDDGGEELGIVMLYFFCIEYYSLGLCAHKTDLSDG